MFFRKDKKNKNYVTNSFSLVVMILVFLFFSQSTFAKTLEKYKENILHLEREFASMLSDDAEKEFIDKVISEVPELLPAKETIEVGETEIEVNNEWINKELDKYKSKTDKKEKKQILMTIFQRLNAINLKIEELEKAAESRTSKDEEKRKLSEILKREEYQKPVEEEESLFQRFLKWLDEWMKKNATPQNNPMPSSNFGSILPFLQFLLFAVVLALIGFLVYKFAPYFIKKFREREKKSKNDRIILGEKISANETSSNLFSEAENLAREGNLRDAIRKGYVAFLFELSERKLIGLAKHKTNRDYLKAVRNKSDLHKNMNGLTLNYERHWYGFDEADEKDWEDFRDNYNEALSQK